jgi:flagellar motor switch protein FliM
MIEPIRELLDAVTSDRGEVDGRWQESLRAEMMRGEVVVNCNLIEKEMRISDVIELKQGDVIPIDMPETVFLEVEKVPVFIGKLGLSDGNYAIEIVEKVTLDNNR